MFRKHLIITALVTGALVAPAQAQDLRSPDTRDSSVQQTQDLRSPDTRESSVPQTQDLRSPDARLGVPSSGSGTDLRSPDARDAGRPPLPVQPVDSSEPTGFDPGEPVAVALGAALVALFGFGILAVVTRRKQRTAATS